MISRNGCISYVEEVASFQVKDAQRAMQRLPGGLSPVLSSIRGMVPASWWMSRLSRENASHSTYYGSSESMGSDS